MISEGLTARGNILSENVFQNIFIKTRPGFTVVPPDLLTMIVHHRSVFSLEEDKRGETNLLQCSI